MQVWSLVADALRRQGGCAMVTVAAVRGSAPREAGARILMLPDGGFHGTIGGGALEWQAIRVAREALARAVPSASLSRHVLGPDLGQCCGGSVKLLIEILDRSRLGEVETLAEQESQAPFTTLGDIRQEMVRRRVLAAPAGGGTALVDGDTRIRECFGARRHPLYLFGAGHVGRALMLALAPLPFSVVWVDERDEAFPDLLPANIQALPCREPAASLGGAPAGSFVLVMTHSHAQDLEIVDAALRAGRFPYVGLIGSMSKRARFTHRLARAGLGSGALEPLVCPIGVPGIRSKQPAAIAAAVAAQLLLHLEALSAPPAARGHRQSTPESVSER